MTYILNRLREGPTWAGLFVFLNGAANVNLSADVVALVTQGGTAIAGLLLMALPNAVKKGGQE